MRLRRLTAAAQIFRGCALATSGGGDGTFDAFGTHRFVDFSTPALRRHFCEEEVRLNRRLAPDVYLGVVPVRLGAGGYHFGDDGDGAGGIVGIGRGPHGPG